MRKIINQRDILYWILQLELKATSNLGFIVQYVYPAVCLKYLIILGSWACDLAM